MSWIWRVLVAGIVIGGIILVMLPTAPEASAFAGARDPAVYAPADDNGNDNDLCDNGNPRKQKKCHWNTPDGQNPGYQGPGSANGLTVSWWMSNERPMVNQTFQLSITGDGAPIDRIEWWADGPNGNTGPNNDDLTTLHPVWPCSGAQPCTGLWTVVVRNAGLYNIHARVYDIYGGVAETSGWQPHVSD